MKSDFLRVDFFFFYTNPSIIEDLQTHKYHLKLWLSMLVNNSWLQVENLG